MRLRAGNDGFDRHADDVTASLERFASARMADEDAAGNLGAERRKMDAALALNAARS